MANEQLIREMQETILKQQEALEIVSTMPTRVGVMVHVNTSAKMGVYVMDSSLFEVKLGKFWDLTPGTAVRVNDKTGAIAGVIGKMTMPGEIAYFVKSVDENLAEVELESGTVLVYNNLKKIETGNKVMLDPSGTMIVRDFGPVVEMGKLEQFTRVQWNDIGGLNDAKLSLQEMLSGSNSETLRRFRQKPIKGVLLHGPPGCGKTMLAKAAVTSMADRYGMRSLDSGFIYMKGPEVLSKWVGEAERAIRLVFHKARTHMKNNGYPAVIFIDEADAILGTRGQNRTSDVGLTIVPMFLSEMDGLSDQGAPFIILATNRPDSLDPAVVRDGRMDRKIYVGRPGKPEVEKIFSLNFAGKPIHSADITQFATEELYSERHSLYEVTSAHGKKHAMNLSHIVNGAMVAGIVSRATSNAMHREMQGGRKSGITKEDVTEAVNQTREGAKSLNLNAELSDFLEHHKIEAVEMRRV